MDAMLGGQLRYRLFPAERLQGHLRLAIRGMPLPFPRRSSVPQAEPSLAPRPIFGDHSHPRGLREHLSN
ncbi:hypothetical protein QOZ94_002599 [Xanthobacter agilis]|uniref:Uncharacterized protein n=1 Tax=Xanthobacter agilis TaxID=47492 RepID=A0ABU0LF96_XANAG|nr:hypothetical protein [Xanthobacter agilis]